MAVALTHVNDAANEARRSGDYTKANALVRARVILTRAIASRPSAAAAVPDDEANQSPEQLAQWLDAKYARHHEDEDRQAAAMLRKLAALAQQEPRHE